MSAALPPLSEYSPVYVDPAALSHEIGEYLLRGYPHEIDVEFPSPKTGGRWKLTSRGWVGYIPFPNGAGLSLQPKVPVGNLFRMLEYAYELKAIRLPEGAIHADSLEDLFDRLARILAGRVLGRIRKGLYRAYWQREERLPYARGRVDMAQVAQRPWEVELPCRYREQTADLEDNRILFWTLDRLRRSSLKHHDARSGVLRSHRALQGTISLLPYGPQNCVGRTYSRLNADYRILHALCRFFLENTGPSHTTGSYGMVPFLIDMDRLFELFVAEWMKAHVPSDRLLVQAQESASVIEATWLQFRIDLVLKHRTTGETLCVLDTKYKENLEQADINQVVTYAELKGAKQAVLIYPAALPQPVDALFGHVRVRTSSFSLAGDLEAAGLAFLQVVLPALTA